MYVKKLSIANFRCFDSTELDFNYPGRSSAPDRILPSRLDNVNLFLGDNGSGKSSVLKALVLAILAPIISNSGFQAEYLVRRAPDDPVSSAANGKGPIVGQARIIADLELGEIDSEQLLGSETGFAFTVVQRIGDTEHIISAPVPGTGPNKVDPQEQYRAWQNLFFDNSPAFFLVGYGANRRTERPEGYSEGLRKPRYQRVAGLFEEQVGLVPFTYAYLQLKDRGFLDEARTILNALLPDKISLTERVDGQHRPLFDLDGVLLSFNALSDGFRAFTGWVWDLQYQMSMLQAQDGLPIKLLEIPGVVIVDEIDLFLHPEWQRRVIEQVATTFPKLQFLFSSHSPLVAGTLEPENIFVLNNNKVEQYRENIYGLTPNQILTSSYFGLRSIRAPRTGTLTDLVGVAPESFSLPSHSEQADVADLMLDPKEKARRMLEEIGNE